MSRREFTKPVKLAIIKRATKSGVIYCEKCEAQAKRFHIDHIDPDAMQTDKSRKLTPDDGQLLCLHCHKLKTKDDVAKIAKAKRTEAKHAGVKTAPVRPIKSAGFSPSAKKAEREERRQKTGRLPIPPRKFDIFGRPL